MKNYIGISRDHSASMSHISAYAARDFNNSIESIKDNAIKHFIDTVVSVVQCGGGVDRVVTCQNVTTIKPIAEREYRADGRSTPLFDSIGDLISQFESLPDADDPDVTFLVMAITDGHENDSRIWSASVLSKKIKQLQATDRWTFVFRVPRGEKKNMVRLGFHEGNILEWEQSGAGMAASTISTQTAFSNYYSARAIGATSTDKFYADIASVSLNEVKSTLTDISSEVDVYVVGPENDGVEIRDFVEAQGYRYVKGCAFYQLSKTETIQSYKQIAIRDKTSGAVYSGAAARDLLGVPHTGEIKLSPGRHGQYEIFIQSTSVNRKLFNGTNLMIITQ